jgi:hypothetical protein
MLRWDAVRAVTFITCECGAQVAPIVASTEPGVAFTFEGICPVCLLEIQVGLACRENIVPSDLSEL